MQEKTAGKTPGTEDLSSRADKKTEGVKTLHGDPKKAIRKLAIPMIQGRTTLPFTQ